MIFGIVVPAGILWHLTEGGFDVTRHATRSWAMFFEMIRSREDGNPPDNVNNHSPN
jgi:hypothetical protein